MTTNTREPLLEEAALARSEETVDSVDSQLASLRTTVRTLADAIGALASALEPLPTESAPEAADRQRRGALRAHQLLLTITDPAEQSTESAG